MSHVYASRSIRRISSRATAAIAIASLCLPTPALGGMTLTQDVGGAASKTTVVDAAGGKSSLASEFSLRSRTSLDHNFGVDLGWRLGVSAELAPRRFSPPIGTSVEGPVGSTFGFGIHLGHQGKRWAVGLEAAWRPTIVLDPSVSNAWVATSVRTQRLGGRVAYKVIREGKRDLTAGMTYERIGSGGSGASSISSGSRIALELVASFGIGGKGQIESPAKLSPFIIFSSESVATRAGKQSGSELEVGIRLYLPFKRHRISSYDD